MLPKSRITNLLKKSFSTTSSKSTLIIPTKPLLQQQQSSSNNISNNNNNTKYNEIRTDLNHKSLKYLKSIKNLNLFDPTLDLPSNKHLISTNPLILNSKHSSSIVLINDNDSNNYQQIIPTSNLIDSLPGEDDSVAHLSSITELTQLEIKELFRFPLIMKRVVNMKSKGKMPSMYSLVVVGNGKGLVGVGEGKDETANKAVSKAFNQAVRSMDYVERYESRTVWGNMEATFGSCKIQMRARPPGFGLRVNHYLHQVAKAAGISDLSAKVYGSNNGTRVVKLALSMLHGGTPSLDMADFGGKKGQRKNKLAKGMETAESVGRRRGRSVVVI